MQILEYEYQGTEELWAFSKIKFGKINLLVGDTGTGKTRLLNTIFSLGTNAANKNAKIKTGHWNVLLSQDEKQYHWMLDVKKDDEKGSFVDTETILLVDGEKRISLVERDSNKFLFEGNKIPKLPQDQTSILLLSEENSIRPLYEGFGFMLRRHFSQDALQIAGDYQSIPNQIIEKLQKSRDLESLFHSGLNLNAILYLLNEFFPDVFFKLFKHYQSIFPFVSMAKIIDLSSLHKNISVTAGVPVFCIKEKSLDQWIELGNLSSGMQKVLLILTDIYLLPKGGIYLIDEYENSLGVNAIDFLPNLLIDSVENHQFIITSHHPYLINNIPVKDWYIFHRKGHKVNIQFGDEVIKKFGKSKHEAFISLINDPFYTDGIE